MMKFDECRKHVGNLTTIPSKHVLRNSSDENPTIFDGCVLLTLRFDSILRINPTGSDEKMSDVTAKRRKTTSMCCVCEINYLKADFFAPARLRTLRKRIQYP